MIGMNHYMVLSNPIESIQNLILSVFMEISMDYPNAVTISIASAMMNC